MTYLSHFISPDGENAAIFAGGGDISCLFVLDIKSTLWLFFSTYFLLLWGTVLKPRSIYLPGVLGFSQYFYLFLQPRLAGSAPLERLVLYKL